MGGRGNGGARNSSSTDEFAGALGTRASVNIKDKLKEVLDGQPSPFNKNVMKSLVNPNYTAFTKDEYSRNCALCTVATVLQLKGYDVEAMPRDETWRGSVNIFDVDYSNKDNYILSDSNSKIGEPKHFEQYDNNKRTDKKAILHNGKRVNDVPVMPKDTSQATTMIQDKVKKWGNGSFGELRISWKTGSAHSVVILNMGGKPVVYDSQVHQTHDLGAFMKRVKSERTSLRRLDNAPVKTDLSSKELGKIVKRKDGKAVYVIPTQPSTIKPAKKTVKGRRTS